MKRCENGECLLSVQRMGCEGAYVEEEDVMPTQRVPALCFTNTDLATPTFHNQLQILKRRKKKESGERIKEYLLGKVPNNNTVMKFKQKLVKIY